MIEIKNFSKIYNNEKKAVDDISLKVGDGEIFAFIGHVECVALMGRKDNENE